jgi:hypothetical protein
VESRESWRTEMAKWIGEARAAELADDDDDDDDDDDNITLVGNDQTSKWKQTMLAVLFNQKECPSQFSPAEVDAESVLMEALAEAEKDGQLDDREVEIDSDDKFVG